MPYDGSFKQTGKDKVPFREALAKVVSLVILLFASGFYLIPNNPFDSCMLERPDSYFGVTYRCSNWPWFLYGIVFVGLSVLLGQRKWWFWLPLSLVFCVIAVEELLRFDEIGFFLLTHLVHSPFTHGGLLALGVALAAYSYSRGRAVA